MSGTAAHPGVLDLWDDHAAARDLERNPDLARRHADEICRALEGIEFNPHPSLVPLRPVILPDGIRSALDEASLYLAGLIHRVCWNLTDEPADLAHRVGLLEDQVPLLGAAGGQHEIDYSTCNGRFDVILKDSVPMFLEANFGAANMDPVVSHFLLRAYRTLYGLAPRRYLGSIGEPFEGRARLYRRLFRERQLPESVAIVGTMHGSSAGDARYYEAEASYLRSIGIESAFIGPSYFSAPRRAQPYSIALKHFMSEYWNYIQLPIEGVRAAHADTVFLVPDSGIALSSKLVLAWLSSGEVPLAPGDRHFVQRHIPWTRRTGRGEVEFEGRSWALAELAVKRQRDFVLKPLNNCGGEGVVLGRTAEPERWRSLIEAAVAERDHVIQLLVDGDALAMDFFDRKAGALRRSEVTYVLGAYLVDGVNAGNSIRHIAGGNPGVVNVAQGAALNVLL